MAKPATARSPERAPDDEDEDRIAEADAAAEAREAEIAERIRTGKAKERVIEPDEPRKPNPEAAQREEEPAEGDEEIQQDPGEVEARRFGWKPESEWRSAKPWQSAKDFLAVTFANRALFESRFEDYKKDQDKTNKELLQKVQDASEIIGEMFRDQKKIRKQEYDRARNEIEGERKTAIAAGDVDRVEALEAQRAEIDKLEEEEVKPEPVIAKPATKKPAEKVEEDAPPQEVIDWIAENPWFAKDKTLSNMARTEHNRLIDEEPGLSLAENLQRVSQKVMETYPDKFGSKRATASQVGSPRTRTNGGAAPGGKKAKSFENLPPDAQATCLKWEKSGVMTRAQYVRDYEWDL